MITSGQCNITLFFLKVQGAPGEGDKDTFLAAASVRNETEHASRQGVRSIGHWSEEKGKGFGSAMMQFDPVEDFRITI